MLSVTEGTSEENEDKVIPFEASSMISAEGAKVHDAQVEWYMEETCPSLSNDYTDQ